MKIDLRTYDDIQKIEFGQGNDYTTGCLLSYTYLKEYHKLIAIDLSKQQSFAANRKAMPQNNFPGNLARNGNAKMFFITESQKKLF